MNIVIDIFIVVGLVALWIVGRPHREDGPP